MPKRLIPNEIESTVALRHEASTARNSRFRYRVWSRPEKERSNNRQFSSVIHIRFEPPKRITHVLDLVPDRLVWDRTNALHNGGTLIGKPMRETLGAEE